MEDIQLELKEKEYQAILRHIDDLKSICDKLKVNLGLLEIPIKNVSSRVLPAELSALPDDESSSEESSGSSDDADV